MRHHGYGIVHTANLAYCTVIDTIVYGVRSSCLTPPEIFQSSLRFTLSCPLQGYWIAMKRNHSTTNTSPHNRGLQLSITSHVSSPLWRPCCHTAKVVGNNIAA